MKVPSRLKMTGTSGEESEAWDLRQEVSPIDRVEKRPESAACIKDIIWIYHLIGVRVGLETGDVGTKLNRSKFTCTLTRESNLSWRPSQVWEELKRRLYLYCDWMIEFASEIEKIMKTKCSAASGMMRIHDELLSSSKWNFRWLHRLLLKSSIKGETADSDFFWFEIHEGFFRIFGIFVDFSGSCQIRSFLFPCLCMVCFLRNHTWRLKTPSNSWN